MSITSLFSSSGFLTINKRLVKALGGLESAGMFSSLCAKHDYWDSRNELQDGFFYCTQDYIQDELGLSKKKQLRICRELECAGVITTKTMGLPKRKYYRINTKIALSLIENTQYVQNGDTDMVKMANKQDKSNKIKLKNHYTITKDAIGSRVFVDQLDADKYPACREAMSVLKAMKKSGASNLYDGPLTIDEWDKAEEGLQGVVDRGENMQEIMLAAYNDRFRTPTYSQPDSVNLCYFVQGYDESNDGNRLLHMASAY